MRLFSNKAIDQWLRIVLQICTGLCCTQMHAIPSDLLIDVDPAKYVGVDLLFSSFGPCPSGNSRSWAIRAVFTANIQYFCASIWNPERSVKLISRRK